MYIYYRTESTVEVTMMVLVILAVICLQVFVVRRISKSPLRTAYHCFGSQCVHRTSSACSCGKITKGPMATNQETPSP